MKLPYTEVKFYTEVKSQTGLSSLRVSCKRAPRKHLASLLFEHVLLFKCMRNAFAPLITVVNRFPLVITVGNKFPLVITVMNTFPPLLSVGNRFPPLITVGNTFPLVITVASTFPSYKCREDVPATYNCREHVPTSYNRRNTIPLVITVENTFPPLITVGKNKCSSFFLKKRGTSEMLSMGHRKLLIATSQGDNLRFLNNTRKPVCVISVLISRLRK